MYRRMLIFGITSLLLVSLLLSACGIGGSVAVDIEAVGMADAMASLQERFPVEMPRGEGIGGTLNYALALSSPFTGMLNPAFSITADDGRINDFLFTDLLHINSGNMYGHNGPAWYEFDTDAATITLHFHDDTAMYWHDGFPVTMYDLEFAIKTIAHPDTFSDRFGPAMNTSTILGVDEFRNGTRDYISGVRVFNNGRSLEYSFESIDPGMLFGGIWTQPIPRHRWENIPFVEHRDHPYSRFDVIGNGAFMLSHTIPGEAVSLVANPNFWLGAPALDGINIAQINHELIGEAMLIGQFDVVDFPVGILADYERRFTNGTWVSTLDRRFDFLGFRFGFMDHDAQTFTPNPDTIINCIYLRRALGYARDDITPSSVVFGGTRFPLATTLIPWQGHFMREDMEGFSIFDKDLANQILDDAGYIWNEGERFRRHKDTDEFFEIVWAVHANATNPRLVPHHIQNWADIGLNVVLYTGGLMEFNDRIETLTHDLDGGVIHMYESTVLKGSNPNPRGLWGVSAHNNTRYQSPRLDAILDAIDSDIAWDEEWLIRQYYDWQLAVYEEAPWIPVTTGVVIWGVNNRVLNFSLERKDGVREISRGASHLWDLTSSTAYSAN